MARKATAKARSPIRNAVRLSPKKIQKILKPALTREDAIAYDSGDTRSGERAWQKLAGAEPGRDVWNDVEEHLLHPLGRPGRIQR